MHETRQAAGTRRTAQAANEKTRSIDKAHEQALHHYQSAVQLMQEGKFEKARAAFEKLIPSAREYGIGFLSVVSPTNG